MNIKATSKAWLLTVPLDHDKTALNGVEWHGRAELLDRMKAVFPAPDWVFTGQCEKGGKTDYEHAQVMLMYDGEGHAPECGLIWNKLDKVVHAEPVGRTRKKWKEYERVYAYVHKEDTRIPIDQGGGDFEQGDCMAWMAKNGEIMKSAGRRTDLADIKQLALNGVSYEELLDDPKYERYITTATKYERLYRRYQDKYMCESLYDENGERHMEAALIWGSPGTGKSRYARQFMKGIHGEEAYSVNNDGPYKFEEYKGQKGIIMDEFVDADMPLTQVNQLLDTARLELKCRYSNKWAYWDYAVIVSNHNPITYYADADEDTRRSFYRRIGQFVLFHTEKETDEYRYVGVYDMTEWVRGKVEAASYNTVGMDEWLDSHEPVRTFTIPVEKVKRPVMVRPLV